MKPRRIDWYPVDWLDGVAAMPPDQRGVYDTIINLIYAHGDETGIEMDERELALRCYCHWRELRRILAVLVSRGKVAQDGRRIYITRCADELHKARMRLSQASHNASKRWNNNSISYANASRSSNARAGDNHQSTTSKEEDSVANATAESASADPPPSDQIGDRARDLLTAGGLEQCASADPPPDPIKVLWDRARNLLTAAGVAKVRVGPLIGRWRRDFGDSAVMAAFDTAERELPSDLVPFLIGCMSNSGTRGNGNGKGRLTPANKRFIAGREATFRAVLAAEERDRAAATCDEEGDRG